MGVGGHAVRLYSTRGEVQVGVQLEVERVVRVDPKRPQLQCSRNHSIGSRLHDLHANMRPCMRRRREAASWKRDHVKAMQSPGMYASVSK